MFKISPVPERILISSNGRVEQRSAGVAEGMKNADNDEELRQACADFESLFLYRLMKSMRRTIPESGLLAGGLSQDIYRDMLDEKIANAAAESGRGTGIGERLYMDVLRTYGENMAINNRIHV